MNNYDFWNQQRGGQSSWQINAPSAASYTAPRQGIPADNYKGLAGDINQFMTGQAVAPYLANLPNYAANVGQFSQNTTSQLKGQLPTDVIQQISQQAAERGISNGLGNGGNNNAAYLRALGLNSNQQMQQGAANLHQSIADTPVPQLFNPASLVAPQINANLALNQAQNGMRAGQGGGGGGGFTIAGGGLPANYYQQNASPQYANPVWTGGGQQQQYQTDPWQPYTMGQNQNSVPMDDMLWDSYSDPSGGSINASDPSQAWMFE